ncbi:hypothetical protein HAZELMIKA_64 [Klebsiella phage vB_KaeD_HazelMika]|nr:hypothetical protein HAZELMIKA_64 [Klebsiella phage vB_KaeD_HazelMika]
MKRFKILAPIALLTALALTGCDDSTRVPREQRGKVQVTTAESGRVQVRKISEFRDDLAYDDYRGVYIITDTETGQEFIGVSGVGISAIGQHNCGKSCWRKDER